MPIEIFDRRHPEKANKMVEISYENWRILEPKITDLLEMWGDFFGPSADGKLTPDHCRAIYKRIEGANKLPQEIIDFFARAGEGNLTYYTYGD